MVFLFVFITVSSFLAFPFKAINQSTFLDIILGKGQGTSLRSLLLSLEESLNFYNIARKFKTQGKWRQVSIGFETSVAEGKEWFW